MGISGNTHIDDAQNLLKEQPLALQIGTNQDLLPLLVPIVEEYKYLGTTLHYSYSLQLILDKQASCHESLPISIQHSPPPPKPVHPN